MGSFGFLILSTFVISLLSLSGIVLFLLQKRILEKISVFLIAFAAGVLLGAAFLHLLPEGLEEMASQEMLVFPLVGFLGFFLLEKTLHLHALYKAEHAEPQNLGVLSLVGDALHNFLDGLILGTAFLLDFRLGLVSAIAVGLHEIPQEISELGVLLYAGFAKGRAILFNFLSATTVILGGVVGYMLGGIIKAWTPFVILFAVGTFLYLGASTFLPEIRKIQGWERSWGVLVALVGGMLFMWAFTFLE